MLAHRMEKLHSQPLIFCATTVACQVPCRCEGFQSLAAALPTPARGNIDGLPRGFKVQGPNVTPIPWQDWQDWQDDCPASFCIEMKSSNDASLPFSLAPAALLFFQPVGLPCYGSWMLPSCPVGIGTSLLPDIIMAAGRTRNAKTFTG